MEEFKFEIGQTVKVVKGDPSTLEATGNVIGRDIEKISGQVRYLVEGEKMWAAINPVDGQATSNKQYYYENMITEVSE